jgi:hypothetical protein
MICETPECDKEWQEPDGEFPMCLIPFCPLRAKQIELTAARSGGSLFQTSASAAVNIGKTSTTPQVVQSLESLRRSCGSAFAAYNMDGALSAKSTVTLKQGTTRQFTTTDQMHSEMVAIDRMLSEDIWTVYLGHVVWKDDHSPITAQQFTTTEPHCGFCTIFLIAAGLPVTTPTYGNHKLASRLSYMLPVALEVSPHFMAKVLDKGCYCGFPAVKRVLNTFVKLDSKAWILSIGGAAYADEVGYTNPADGLTVLEWFDLVNETKREVIYQMWKIIFEQIMLTNKVHNS